MKALRADIRHVIDDPYLDTEDKMTEALLAVFLNHMRVPSEVTGERWEVQSRGRDRWHVVRARETEAEAREAMKSLAELHPYGTEELRIRHVWSVAETIT